MNAPVLLIGPPGIGKTQLAEARPDPEVAAIYRALESDHVG